MELLRWTRAQRILCRMSGTVYRDPPTVQGRGTRELRPAKTNWWLVAFGVGLVLGALYVAYLVFHSNEPRQERVVFPGTAKRSLAISSDGKLLASGALAGSLRIFSTADSPVVASTRLPTSAMAASFAPGGTIVAPASYDPHVHILSRA